MHHIQRSILYQLMQHPSRRYGQLKPQGVEGNIFTYHVRQLIGLGYVVKGDGGEYELTAAGKVYVDRLSGTNLLPRIQPKIITLIACRNEEGEWLVFRRRRQPLLGKVGFVYGKIHEGERIADAARRELKEKTGLQAQLEHRGDGYITMTEAGQVVSQVMFHLFIGMAPQGELQPTASGEAFWMNHAAFGRPDVMPSMPDLIGLLKSKRGLFFAELRYDA